MKSLKTQCIIILPTVNQQDYFHIFLEKAYFATVEIGMLFAGKGMRRQTVKSLKPTSKSHPGKRNVTRRGSFVTSQTSPYIQWTVRRSHEVVHQRSTHVCSIYVTYEKIITVTPFRCRYTTARPAVQC